MTTEQLIQKINTTSALASHAYYETRLMLCLATDSQQEQLLEYYRGINNEKVVSMLQYIMAMEPPFKDFYELKRPNTPVKELLKNFSNKRSKKVSAARKELVSRYEYLSGEHQLAFRLALLQSGNKTDCMTACKYCLERWDGKELPLVLSIWEEARKTLNYDTWFWTSRVLIRFAEEDFVVANQTHLFTLGDGMRSSILYYYVALRIPNRLAIPLRKEWLTIKDYYRVLYHTRQEMNAAEWEDDFFQLIANIYPGQPLLDSPIIRSFLLYGALNHCSRVPKMLEYIHRVDGIG